MRKLVMLAIILVTCAHSSTLASPGEGTDVSNITFVDKKTPFLELKYYMEVNRTHSPGIPQLSIIPWNDSLKHSSLNSSRGIFSIGAIWYWKYPDPAFFFYYRESVSGIFEISFSITMEDLTPSLENVPVAPLAPSAPV